MTEHGLEDDILIDPNDFKSYKLKVAATNLTTQTQISADKKFVRRLNDPSEAELKVVEFDGKNLRLEIPPHSGAVGHQLMLHLQTENTPEEISLQATAKVEHIEQLENGMFEFLVVLTQYDSQTLNQLVRLFDARQQQILDFFHSVKG